MFNNLEVLLYTDLLDYFTSAVFAFFFFFLTVPMAAMEKDSGDNMASAHVYFAELGLLIITSKINDGLMV